MNRGKHHLRSERGFTALELIIVLVVGLSIIALSAQKMGDMFASSKGNQAMSNIVDLTAELRTLYTDDNYGTENSSLIGVLEKAGVMPKGLKKNDTNYVNEWNAVIEISSNGPMRGFTIKYPNVPRKVCSKLASNLLNMESVAGIRSGQSTISSKKSSVSDITTLCATNDAHTMEIFILHMPSSASTRNDFNE